MSQKIKSGVATGDEVQEIFKLAKEKNFALPAVNVTGSDTINAVFPGIRSTHPPQRLRAHGRRLRGDKWSLGVFAAPPGCGQDGIPMPVRRRRSASNPRDRASSNA